MQFKRFSFFRNLHFPLMNIFHQSSVTLKNHLKKEITLIHIIEHEISSRHILTKYYLRKLFFFNGHQQYSTH